MRLAALSGVASYTRRDEGSTNTNGFPTRQPHARLSATQPLFRGGRDLAVLRQTEALTGAQSEDYRAARVQLFQDVAQNFYDALALEQDLMNLDEQIEQNRLREKELQARVRIGRSRVSEVLTVQAAISALRAQVEQLRAQLSAAREAFAFLSGLLPARRCATPATAPTASASWPQRASRRSLRT